MRALQPTLIDPSQRGPAGGVGPLLGVMRGALDQLNEIRREIWLAARASGRPEGIRRMERPITLDNIPLSEPIC